MFVPRLAIAFTLATTLAATQVHAAFILTLDDLSTGAVDYTIYDDDFQDLESSEPGLILFSKSFGVFKVTVTTGQSKPFIGEDDPHSAEMYLSFVVTTTGTGTIRVSLTDTDFALDGQGPSVPFTLMHDIGGTTDGTVVAQSFVDFGNAAFGLAESSGVLDSTVAMDGPRAFGDAGSVWKVFPDPFPTGKFSMTQVVTVSHVHTGTGTKKTSFDYDSRAHLPEPSALVVLLGLTMCLGLATGWRRWQKRTAT